MLKDNFGIIGDQVHKTLLITGLSTTQQAATQHSVHKFGRRHLTLNTQNCLPKKLQSPIPS
jgi:hypothetical protein